MDEPNWSRAYYAVFACACIAILATTLSAADGAARIRPILLGDKDSPGISKVFLQIPVPVYYVVGGLAVVAIGFLGIYRRRFVAVFVSAAILAACVCFNTVALWAVQWAPVNKLYSWAYAHRWHP